MTTLQIIFIAIVALLHTYFLILEMFLWTTPKGIKAFGLKSKEFAEETKVLAANQGLYNGFLAAGLIWSILTSDFEIAIFFLSCVVIAGIYGAYSTKKSNSFISNPFQQLLDWYCCIFKIEYEKEPNSYFNSWIN